jgi:hypothetical protein
VHFELSGLNIKEALSGDPSVWVGRYTAWELQQVVGSSSLFNRTKFYLRGVQQTPAQIAQMGIRPPISESIERLKQAGVVVP